jgi:phosphatidylethanolamine N-methyltransferase
VSGEIEFSGDKLDWSLGIYEFRYHHNGKHNVMAISRPFELRIGKFDEEDVEVDSNGLIQGPVEDILLPLVRNCFDQDPEIAPTSKVEAFGSLVDRDEKYAKRVVYAVHQMYVLSTHASMVTKQAHLGLASSLHQELFGLMEMSKTLHGVYAMPKKCL